MIVIISDQQAGGDPTRHPVPSRRQRSRFVAVGLRRLGSTEHGVDRLARPVVGVGPQVRVGVQGFSGGGVAEPALHGLDRLAVSDEQRGVEVAQFVKAGPAARPHHADGRAPDLAGEGSAPQRPVGFQNSVAACDQRFQAAGS
jgi:hypothetical protein